MKKSLVTVLLSAYNGEDYIDEQIDSILKQKQVGVKLIIRDDGSQNPFKNKLTNYANIDKRISVIYGENKGVVGSFLELIDGAPKSEYYALSDQDDIWYDDKLQRAINLLHKETQEIPLLYAANQNHVDRDLNFICKHFKNKPVISLEKEMFSNEFSGCTMVFNRKFLELMQQDKSLRKIAFLRMHDTWMMYLALLYGKFIYDDVAVMDFRRHGNNVSNGGISNIGLVEKIKNNFLILSGNKINNYYVSNSAKIVIENCTEDITKVELYTFDLLANYKENLIKKIKLCFCKSLFEKAGIDRGKAVLKIFLNMY